MTHYICTGGCNGVSPTPGSCQAESCPLYGHELVACNCQDGLHKEILEKMPNPHQTEEK